MQRHKILFVIPGLRQGGAERQLLELVRRLPDRFEPMLCVFEADEIHYQEYLAPGEPRHVLGAHKISRASLRKLAGIIADEKPAIVHCYRDRANLWTRVAMKVHGVYPPILITSVRNRGLDLLNLLTEATLAKFTDRVLTNSVGVRDDLRRWARVPGEKIQVIPNFVDLTRFRPPASGEREAARQKFGLATTDQVLVLPGRVSIQKHQLGLLAALRRVSKAGGLPRNTRILLAGRERDRLYSRLVRRFIVRWGLSDCIRLVGSVSDVLGLYHSADLVLMPSLYEGMPNAVIEGHACGLPVLVSRAANVDHLVVPGQTGFEVPTADRHALAETLARVLTLSKTELETMGQRGREHMLRMLDNEAILGMFTSLYDRLLAGP
jgi:glycosyltransferase involved in cell wall biosynthesis